MKLKRLPEDFQVEEIPTVRAGDRGRFMFYRLEKRGLGTLEAIEAIRRRWNLNQDQIAHGGLKDRHAITIQYLTIRDGPQRELNQTNIELVPLGQLEFPYGPRHFRGNRFTVVLRDLSAERLAAAVSALVQIEREGVPNYFDDQRFGSLTSSGEFIAHAWLVGDYERALRLAIAEPMPLDRPGVRQEKQIVAEHWGNWPRAKELLDRSHSRSIVTYLADHPADFRGAFARLRRDLRSLYFSAFQSHLWNLLLNGLLVEVVPQEERVAISFKTHELNIPRGLGEQRVNLLKDTRIPLPCARTKAPEGDVGTVAGRVLAEFGLAWTDLRVKHLKDTFFSKGDRLAMFVPANLTHRAGDDELYAGRRALTLAFELPKGSYATLVVKRITDAA